jgi:ATP-dependent DNA helicase RecG
VLSNEDTLHNLGVLEFVDGEPVLNNTGVLFFSKEPQLFLPQAIIQCVRYKGLTKVDIEDQKDMTFDIMTNIDESFVFLRRSLDVAFKIESGSPTRKEVWEIPYIALREALVNAISHRDYINKGTHIQVEVFDDRISITNFGGLVAGLSQDDLGKRSLHRNPNIVNILHRSNFIEKLGTGLLRIDSEIEKAGLPKVEFDINDNWFSIIFKREVKKIELPKLDFVLLVRDLLILEACRLPKSRLEVLVGVLKISKRRPNYEKNMEHLVKAGLLIMTNPDVPTDPTQKYYTSDLGKLFIKDTYENT